MAGLSVPLFNLLHGLGGNTPCDLALLYDLIQVIPPFLAFLQIMAVYSGMRNTEIGLPSWGFSLEAASQQGIILVRVVNLANSNGELRVCLV